VDYDKRYIILKHNGSDEIWRGYILWVMCLRNPIIIPSVTIRVIMNLRNLLAKLVLHQNAGMCGSENCTPKSIVGIDMLNAILVTGLKNSVE
jgi:hypothetical protein